MHLEFQLETDGQSRDSAPNEKYYGGALQLQPLNGVTTPALVEYFAIL